MNIIFFAHPAFLKQQSMIRFASFLAEGMRERGHQVSIWSPEPKLFKLSHHKKIKKWLGYLDQYLLFPIWVRKQLKHCPPETLFVFIDQALGPWVPLVAERPHVIHCHDFLAQRSALGEIPENPTGFLGRVYQAMIRRGYRRGKSFIPTSDRTRQDLLRFLEKEPAISTTIYNGLNQDFVPMDKKEVRSRLATKMGIALEAGYLLHIGGNTWYKNRRGVIEIYNAWRLMAPSPLPLLMMGETPGIDLLHVKEASPFQEDIRFLIDVDNETLRFGYAGASLFIFPSLAEGFGWPIAEAMASGCPVLTTDEAPMTEVADHAAFFIPRRPNEPEKVTKWAKEAALVVNQILKLGEEERKEVIAKGLSNAERFDSTVTLNCIEAVYFHIA